MSNLWFNKQMLKNKPKKVENIYTKTNTNINTNDEIKEEENIEMNNKKVLTVAVDAGKGYTKWAYKVPGTIKNKEGIEEPGMVWVTDLEISTVIKGEADFGSTTYIKNEGEEKFSPYNFNVRTKAVENEDKTKNNAEHKALMQRALYKIAKKTGITDFEVIMCISLDQFKLSENVEKMQKDMFTKEFIVKTDNEELTINIHKLIIEPETLGAVRFAKKTKLKQSNVVLVDIGTLNMGVVPIEKQKLVKEDITAPRVGYDYMINKFKEYSDSKGLDYKKSMLEIYVDEHQGSGHKLDAPFKEFFRDVYAPIIKKEIKDKGFGEFSKLVFVGGTSCKCKELIEENFRDEYLGVEVVKDIFATVKGAYEKGLKNLEKAKEM